MVDCPDCGEGVDADSRFCPNCGAELGTGESALHEDERGVDFAVYYPQRDGWRAPVISGLLLLGSFLVVPLFALLGYSLRVGRAAAHGEPTPPEYDDWGGLIVDGLRFLAVLAVAGGGLAVLVYSVSTAVSTTAASFRTRTLLSALARLVGYYAFFAFVVAFLGSDGVADAFVDGRAIGLLTSRLYAIAVLWSLALFIALYFAAVLVGIFGLAPWTFAYALVATTAYWGYVYYRAAEEGIVPSPAAADVDRSEPEPAGQSA